jgi:hypothetical protein
MWPAAAFWITTLFFSPETVFWLEFFTFQALQICIPLLVAERMMQTILETSVRSGWRLHLLLNLQTHGLCSHLTKALLNEVGLLFLNEVGLLFRPCAIQPQNPLVWSLLAVSWRVCYAGLRLNLNLQGQAVLEALSFVCTTIQIGRPSGMLLRLYRTLALIYPLTMVDASGALGLTDMSEETIEVKHRIVSTKLLQMIRHLNILNTPVFLK